MPLSPTVLLSQATVLVVDDEESVRLYTSRVMEEAGYHVLTAGDGIQAMAVLQQSRLPVQLVITDVSMPRMTGPELAAHIATERHGPPVLFISGGYSSELPGPFLRKPFLPHHLSRLARRMLCGPMSPALRLAHGECQEVLMPALVSAGS
ncbi:MAG: response regulator [Gemmatimonadota bacterium]|nr:response regulator [Gemmatimonadota bacterium]